MGIALACCTSPAKGSTIFQPGGVGIHGEFRTKRMKIEDADEIVEGLMARLPLAPADIPSTIL